MADIRTEMQAIFRRVFDDDDLEITDGTTAADVNGWDSMAHINLIIAMEKKFAMKLTSSEIASLRGNAQNVGNLIRLVETKVGSTGPGPGASNTAGQP
jgi:acyl carrier protein